MGESPTNSKFTLDVDVYSPPTGLSKFVSIYTSEEITDFENEEIVIEL